MSSVSSNGLSPQFSPQQLPFDSSTLSEKSTAFSNGSSNGAINFGGDSNKGTDFDSLFNTDSSQDQNSDNNQITQLLSELLKQILPLLQQLLQGQQGGDSKENSQPGTRSPLSNLSEKATQSPQTGGQQTPSIPTLDQQQTAGGTPTPTPTSASGNGTDGVSSGTQSVSTGSGDLHLPDSLKPYEEDIQNAAQATGVPANVLAAQIWQESRGQLGQSTTNGGNGLSDSGLMQVNSNTFADLQKRNPDLLSANADPNNPRDNIMAGALYMKDQLNAFDGNMGAALRAYNSGPGNVNTSDLSDISKTGTGDSTYVDKVQDFANIIATGNGSLPA